MLVGNTCTTNITDMSVGVTKKVIGQEKSLLPICGYGTITNFKYPSEHGGYLIRAAVIVPMEKMF